MPQAEEFKERFDQLYRDHYIKVYRLACWLTNRGNTAADRANDAEDITQETFLRAFRSFHTFSENSSFFAWIYRIAINVSNDYMKRNNKLPVYAISEALGCSEADLIDPNPANDPETAVLANEVMRCCLVGFTECLPLNQKKAFFLIAGMGLSHKLAAEILDCTPGSIKTTLHRAKENLLACMESRCSLIKKSNPCHCEQWVKAGLLHGWITKGASVQPPPKITMPDKVRIYMRDPSVP